MLVIIQVRSTGAQVQSTVTHCWKPNPDHGHTLQTLLPGNQPASHRHLSPSSLEPTAGAPVPHLLLDATGILQPLIWLSSVSEISICSGRRGTQTVISTWEVKCWWVKLTIVPTLLFISFPFTKIESQVLETLGRERQEQETHQQETCCTQILTSVQVHEPRQL